jgi:hypothetical protein
MIWKAPVFRERAGTVHLTAHQALILPDVRIRTSIGEVPSKAFDAEV